MSSSEFEFDSTESFIEDAQMHFDQEHNLPQPRQQRLKSGDGKLDYEFTESELEQLKSANYSIYHLDDSGSSIYTPPTLLEQINNLENARDVNKNLERSEYFERERDSFGFRYRICSRYTLDTEDTISGALRIFRERLDGEKHEAVEDEWKVAALENRVALYRYLQHLGLVLVDDTGISAYSDDTDHEHGFLFLPKEIEKEAYYRFEDKIRAVLPFSDREVTLAKLKHERDTGTQPKPGDIIVDDRALREMVDSLAMEEEFFDMFTKAAEIREARKKAPRVDLREVATIEPIKTSFELPELPELPELDI